MANNDIAILDMLGCIYEELDTDSIEKRFVDLVGDIFFFDRIALLFVKHKKEILQGKLSRGFEPEMIKKLEMSIKGDSFFIKPLITGIPVRKAPEDTDRFIKLLGLSNCALIPIVNKKRVSCWEIKNCKADNCPAYGKKWLRCWLIEGTKCSDGSEVTSEGKARHCAACPVFVNLNFEAVEGVMLVDNSISNKPIAEDVITILSIIAHTVGIAINNSKLYMRTLDVTIKDDLTGLHNRRYFNERLFDEVRRAPKYGEAVSLIMCDIDHFKQVNDGYGHPLGDAVLCWVGDMLQKNLRKVDVVSRYGGEEFAILLLNTEQAGAVNLAEKLRQSMERSPFRHPNAEIKITLSFGVATLGVDSNTFEGLIAKADKALYYAKSQGRNKVCVC